MGTSRQNEVIYKRRRLAALVILLVVVVLIIAGVTALRGGSSDDESENTAATSPLLTTSAVEANTGDAAGSSVDSTADPDATDTADKSEEPRESGEATASPSETSTTGPAKGAKDSCELSDLIITASSNKPNFTPGEQPQLYMTVGNPTTEDCEIDLDDSVLRFEIYDLASNARIWSDVDCNPAVETGTRVFPAGEERFFQAIWSRTGSAPEQCSNRQLVPAGSYFLHTVIGDNPSQAHTFNLR